MDDGASLSGSILVSGLDVPVVEKAEILLFFLNNTMGFPLESGLLISREVSLFAGSVISSGSWTFLELLRSFSSVAENESSLDSSLVGGFSRFKIRIGTGAEDGAEDGEDC